MSAQTEVQEAIKVLRKAQRALDVTVRNACPDGKKHHPVQHRDMNPPWCHACGRTAAGTVIGAHS